MDDILAHDGSFAVPGGPWAAVVVCRTPQGNFHAGLLYKTQDGTQALHLGWEDRLYNQLNWGGMWAAPRVEPELLFAAARMCRRVWRRFELDRKFPYGLTYLGSSFDTDGRLVLGPGARGLTCATFIIAVLRSVGVLLVNETSWPIRTVDDLEFLAHLRPHATPEHFAILQREVEQGVQRIRPEEVTAACLVNLPACFEETRPLADAILARLDRQDGS